MKKKFLLLAGLLCAAGMQAQTSPWVGNDLPAEGGTFYLYNVATGKWLQNNNFIPEDWTTRAQVGPYGLDIEFVAEEGGYRLNPKFGRNHSINGWDDFLYLDTDRPVTIWTVEKKTNGFYRIYTGNEEHFLNTNDDGFLDDFGWDEDWVLVTKEQRLADMETATKDNPKDATWLIGGHDFANMDERNKWEVTQEGDGNAVEGGDGIVHANRCWECWKKTKFVLKKTITGLPNGTYKFRLQGFYRDGSESQIANKRDSGTEEIRASYFLNDVSRPFMSILDSGVTEYDEQSYAIPYNGIYFPGNSDGHQNEWWGNAHNRASNCFFKGGYWNDPVEVVVSDGTLTIGMQKIGGGDDDWMLFDSFELTYLGSEIDLSYVKGNLQAAIDDAQAYNGTAVAVLTSAIADAQAAMSSTDAAAIAQAASALRDALAAAKDYTNVMAEAEAFDGVMVDFFAKALADAQAAAEETDLEAFNEAIKALRNALNDVRGVQEPLQWIAATIPFAEQVGVAGDVIANAQAVLQHADKASDIHDALNQLRVARKIQVADKAEDVFKGAEPADGDFFIYNVGLKRFLCGGGDWGAHAYVGFPGVEVTLMKSTEYPDEGDPFDGYLIDTHLPNGADSEYLNYGGYMDTPHKNLWEFVPVEGKPGVYNMVRANGETNSLTGERLLLGYRPGTLGNMDTDMTGMDNPNNQWKLVTRAERDELLATATADNPQDATYKILSPNFNQREDVSAWASQYGNGQIWERGINHSDFAYECWNGGDFDFSQNVYDLLPGWYRIGVQGYYRDGNHQDQIRAEAAGEDRARTAVLVDMESFEMVELPNILDEVDKAPGEGNRSTTRFLIQETDGEGQPIYNEDETPRMIEDPNGERLYVGEFPMWINEACNYFQNGLYKAGILVEITHSDLMILVQKMGQKANDWVVLDNFRLTYYGTEKPTEEQQGIKENAIERPATGKLYNLQGQQVKNAQKGLFIFDGKKFFKK